MIRGKIHEESGKQYCFVEVEIESDNEDTFISDYLRVLGKLRLGHQHIDENGFTEQETASKARIDLLKRLAKDADKELSSITEYVAKKFRKPTIQQLTKQEASDVIDLLTPKKGEK